MHPRFSFGPTQFSNEAVATYCDACHDTNPIHSNEEVARRAGLPSCIVPGGLLVFLMERAMLANFPQARIIEIRTRFTAPLLIGGAVYCEGRDVRQNVTSDARDMRLIRLSCLDETRKILCLGDVLFSFSCD